jgi:drug/metabolite transporter (DMT)-like permease
MSPSDRKNFLTLGIVLAIGATIIWSGNFIVARAVIRDIPPISLAFYRWLTASIIMLPFAYKKFRNELPELRKHGWYLFFAALSGITLFNTLVYVAGHYTPAINLALIGTTSSPVMAIILAAVFLREKIRPLRIAGLLICISGIVLLISGGSWEKLKQFHFSEGDLWILAGAFCFAAYSILVRRKPRALSPVAFLFAVFLIGTILLLPAFLWEKAISAPVVFNLQLYSIILYLGAGTSVLAFLFWNEAIARLGAARTALFGNLIPVFSTLEAVLILNEAFTIIHAVSGLLVITGLVIANLPGANNITQKPAE